MKTLGFFSLLAVAFASTSFAGSFGGPAPFSDLSPLQSGIDGSYQATARGKNLTGVIRFAYSNGVQSPIAAANNYVFFIDGVVVSGSTTASITGNSLAGVLGGQDFTVPTNDEGSVELPVLFVVRGNRASGAFNGKLDLNDRMSVFNGTGTITGARPETVNFIAINEGTGPLQPPIALISTNVVIPGSEDLVQPTKFNFEGVRTSLTAQGGFTSPSTSTSTGSTSN